MGGWRRSRGGGGGGGGEVSAANPWFEVAHDDAPESPLVAFVNPRSGGRLGPVLKTRLQELIGEDQVNTSSLSLSYILLRGMMCG